MLPMLNLGSKPDVTGLPANITSSHANGNESQSTGSNQPAAGRTAAQDDGLQAQLYRGYMQRTELRGTRVLCKAYPAIQDAGKATELDIMIANEAGKGSPRITGLLGGFQAPEPQGRSQGDAVQQWLVFRDEGTVSAMAWAQAAAEASARDGCVGDSDVGDILQPRNPMLRRRGFVMTLMRQIMEVRVSAPPCTILAPQGLAYMHSMHRLHQSLGPGSVILSTHQEIDAPSLQVQLRDLAFAVDISNEALYGGATLAEIWDKGTIAANDPKQKLAENLWERAREAGAWTALERRNFGIADDIYAAGLLLAYLCFVPFCEPGSVDGPSLQRGQHRLVKWQVYYGTHVKKDGDLGTREAPTTDAKTTGREAI
eukprot:jgi/Astpho2/3128/Aster-x1121